MHEFCIMLRTMPKNTVHFKQIYLNCSKTEEWLPHKQYPRQIGEFFCKLIEIDTSLQQLNSNIYTSIGDWLGLQVITVNF